MSEARGTLGSMATTHNTPSLRELQVLVRRDQRLYRKCKIAVSRADASLYLFPYAASGRYHYGTQALGEGQAELTFDYTTQAATDRVPKISIHESGQVHIRVPGGEDVGPLFVPPLAEWRGQHLATVTVDAFGALPPFDRSVRTSGPRFDLVLGVPEGEESGRLAIYANGERPTFAMPPEIEPTAVLTMRRPSLDGPLHLALYALGQPPLEHEDDPPKATVICGWDPRRTNGEPDEFFFVRGE